MSIVTIARRDLAAYLNGYSAWVIIAAVLLIEGLWFYAFNLGLDSARYSQDVITGFFETAGGCTIVLGVLLSMRSMAAEHQAGTDKLLQSSVARDWQIIVGKFLAGFGMIGLCTVLTLHMPLLVVVHGKVSMGHLAVGYLGVLCIGAATLAIGIFSSTLFRHQLMAGAFAGVTVVFFIVVWFVADITDPPFSEVLGYSAFFNQHLIPFQQGRFVSGGLVFFASITTVFLLLATRILDSRRWN